MAKFSIPSDAENVIMIPLGGCGNIGKNLMLYCYKNTWIMLDCGASFSEERITPGADIIVPDISFIRNNKIPISAIVLTHVHEDHVGAVSHFIKDLKCPVYGTKFALEFLKLRLQDRLGDYSDVKMKEIKSAEIKIGNFTIEPVFLTHSIPEMHGIFIKGGDVKIFHTGDWKFDESPVVGEKSDFSKLEKIAKEGVTAVVCDSTNVLSEGRSQSEGELEHNLYNIVENQKGMVLVTTFASNVARIQTLCNVAKRTGRVVGLSGLSLSKITAIAKKCGYLSSESFMDAKEAAKLPRKEVLMICTGCQGEVLASMAKISNNSHPIIKINAHDTVIFSSKIIPGNEKKISATMNRLADKNINVVTEREAFVHVSGHPKKDELCELYSMLKPKIGIPVHGESVHLRAHCKLIHEKKLADKSIFVKDGDVLVVSTDDVKKVGTVFTDYLCVDGNLLLSPASKTMRERRKIKDSGVVNLSIAIDEKLKIVNIDHRLIGLLDEANTAKAMAHIIKNAQNHLEKYLSGLGKGAKGVLQNKANLEKIEGIISSSVGKDIERKFEKTPIVSVIIHEV